MIKIWTLKNRVSPKKIDHCRTSVCVKQCEPQTAVEELQR